MPRRDLLMGLGVLLESGELKIARRLTEAGGLKTELIRMRANGNGGEHDDLAMALALACWRARRVRNGFGAQRLPGI